MLSQAYYHIASKVKQKYPDAVFYAVSRWKFRYIKAEEWNNTYIWSKELAPSVEALNDYKDSKKTKSDWNLYKLRYLEEMNNASAKEAMLKIAREAASKPVFLFCHCGPKEGKQCHKFLLLNLINDAAQEAGIDIEIQ
ncbi:DUF488 family protein [Methanosarcina hadiensis]|uniref:DUF488 family protein, N3 subclade n=1 Tax=Methanosarcina hadiensis TaxID=3078083 RepID=UPI0039772F7E